MFRPLHYLGRKSSFAAPIKAAIDQVDPSGGRLCDLFAGTGSIGVALASERDVTTVDIQEYSRVICEAQLRPVRLSPEEIATRSASIRVSDLHTRLTWCLEPLTSFENIAIEDALAGRPEAAVALVEAHPLMIRGTTTDLPSLADARELVLKRLANEGLLGHRKATVTNYFGGIYFSYAQAAALDAILNLVDETSAAESSLIKAAALSTASDIVNTVGKQFAQPLRPRDKEGRVKASLGAVLKKDRSADVTSTFVKWLGSYGDLLSTGHDHHSMKDDYQRVIDKHGNDFSVVYADPPYTRDHYSRFYHVLETMCLRDNPEISGVIRAGSVSPSRGIYRKERHQSAFCIRTEAPKAFAALFASAKAKRLPMVLSYSPHEAGDGTHPRVMAANDIIALARSSFRKVEVQMISGSTHNLLNNSTLSLARREHAEMILMCSP